MKCDHDLYEAHGRGDSTYAHCRKCQCVVSISTLIERIRALETIESSATASRKRTTKSRSETSIYVLLDPRDGSVRYVGRAVDPWRRKHGYRVEGWKLLHWLDELRKLKLRPKLQVIATVPTDTAPLAERLAIWIAREMGAELVNTQLNTIGKS